LADMRQSIPEPMRGAIDQKIAALYEAAQGTEEGRLRFIRLFANHPQTAALRRQQTETYAVRGDFLQAEHLLVKLTRGADPTAAAEAVERLARLMLEFKLPADAAYYYEQLERRFGTVVVRDAQTGAQLVQALRDSGKFPEAPAPVLDWHPDSLRVERMGANYSNYVAQELSSIGSPVPFFNTHRFEIEHAAQRLEVIDGLTDELHWSLPLRN